eukprot:TRINITY_DN2238_c1_g3_i1.p1 TRINITY_DN2238_c1_g3~~TRINITY_DN2238_c1_g3_i1.p1  ORF type:complete len:554 (+),score=114.34 TRINITY_DN2238_c1_g3_i1:99-1760(+)
MLAPLIAVVVLPVAIVVASHAETKTAEADLETPLGKIHGHFVGKKEDVTAFMGIPYAESITPSRRFKPAIAKQPWNGTLEAKNCGAQCVQPVVLQLGKIRQAETDAPIAGSEDCLFLNVWKPRLKPTKPLPVLVYIHGGAFLFGNGCVEGAELSRKGLVVVSMNYRLGVFGFLQSEELLREDSTWPSYGGMNGIADQILALRWIKKNIAAFGGDPENVTIWGESAGGASVCELMVSPLAEGLFQRSIIESGSCVGNWGSGSLQQGFDAGRKFMSQINATSISDLRKLSPEILAKPVYGLNFDPKSGHAAYFIDDWVQKEPADVAWAAGRIHGSSLMIGLNSADGLVPVIFSLFGQVGPFMTAEEVGNVSKAAFAEQAKAVQSQYPSYGGRFTRPDAALIVAYRDQCISCPSADLARWANAANLSVFVYLWGSPEAGSPFNLTWPNHSVIHAQELPWLFGRSHKQEQGYWTSFAVSGTPSHDWPRFGSSENKNATPLSPYFYIGDGIPRVDGSPGKNLALPSKEDCKFWSDIRSQRRLSRQLSRKLRVSIDVFV